MTYEERIIEIANYMLQSEGLDREMVSTGHWEGRIAQMAPYAEVAIRFAADIFLVSPHAKGLQTDDPTTVMKELGLIK